MVSLEELDDPRRWYTTNLVGVSSQLLASIDFNAFPRRLSIAATRETHSGLFALLAEAESQADAAEIFAYHMAFAFGLSAPSPSPAAGQVRRYRSTYLKVLQGWGFDANSSAGAVLKGWVESRFGIVPSFHRGPLDHFPSEVWMQYLEEKLSNRFNNNCIHHQLDVLFEYCQWSLSRFAPFGSATHVRLFRGANRSEAQLVRGSLRERRGVIHLNNVVSFSSARDRAEEFGDIVLTAHIPLAKILFFPGLIRDKVLNGEDEVLVLGGDYETQLSYA